MKTLKFSLFILLGILFQLNSNAQELIERKTDFDAKLQGQGFIRQPAKPEVESYKYTEGKDIYEVKAEFGKIKKGNETFDITTLSLFKNGKLESSESVVENSQGNSVTSSFAKSGSCDFANCIQSAINSNKGACKNAKACATKSKQFSNKKDRRSYFLKNCLGFCIGCGVKWVRVLTCVLDCI